jgi:predicted RNA-binding protein YlqC (UPF0109 family)
MKELLKQMVQALVDHPEQIVISAVEGKQSLVLEIKVAKEDMGKVIGKKGRTAQAMRDILNAASGKLKKRTILEIIE